MTDQAFERDLRAYLVARAPSDVPTSLAVKTASLSASNQHRAAAWLERVASFAAAGVALLLVLALTIVAVLSLPRSPDSPGAGAFALRWRTEFATLQANSISIEVSGRAFNAPPDATAKSNPRVPGTPSLQIQWHEDGVPINLEFSIESDDSSWWVSEILTSDGTPAADWIRYRGISDAPLFLTPRGEAFNGDVDLDGTAGARDGHLSIDDMRLTASGIGAEVDEQCTPVAAAPQAVGEVPPDAVAILAGYGIELGMDAQRVDSTLAGHGFCRSYRLEYALGGNRGYSQVWCVPPPGTVNDLAFGSSGEVIAFVQATADAPALIPFVSVGC